MIEYISEETTSRANGVSLVILQRRHKGTGRQKSKKTVEDSNRKSAAKIRSPMVPLNNRLLKKSCHRPGSGSR